VREASVSPFFIDATAVTNQEFAAFVRATGYRTETEEIGWSFVFFALLCPDARLAVNGKLVGAPWWLGVEGAC
jgi:sulfatase modifying factor 1